MDRTKAFPKPQPKKPSPKSPFMKEEPETETEINVEVAPQAPPQKPPMGGQGMEKPSLGMEMNPMGGGGKASLDKAGFLKSEEKCDTCRHFSGSDCAKVDVQFDQNEFDPSLSVCEKFYEPMGNGGESAPAAQPEPPTPSGPSPMMRS